MKFKNMRLALYLLALVLTLATPPAISKSMLYIDTKEQCLKIKGIWASSKYDLRGQGLTMEACYVDMNPYGECAQTGGYHVQGAPDERRCQLPQSEEGKMTQCREKHGLWTMTVWGFLCYSEADERKCREEGGSWEVGGMANLFRCVKTAADAYKPCRDDSECQFGCRYVGPHPSPDQEVVGKCHGSNKYFGCFAPVKNGKLGVGMCVD
ncbi:hypothetical protein [Ferribacterium limneticum]|uniref:hypothetical protein n=1 Tax=Ferribacterium limneticum TaxID=76259 RepID=UPI001CF7F0D4|nr:hypothetical protein [Ferribacterium limneticum]UCV21862.1 hypothetical protein KI613_15165 [Ferribacterium limneticum]